MIENDKMQAEIKALIHQMVGIRFAIAELSGKDRVMGEGRWQQYAQAAQKIQEAEFWLQDRTERGKEDVSA